MPGDDARRAFYVRVTGGRVVLMKNNNRRVILRPDGSWGSKLTHGVDTSSTHQNQKEAIEEATEQIRNDGAVC